MEEGHPNWEEELKRLRDDAQSAEGYDDLHAKLVALRAEIHTDIALTLQVALNARLAQMPKSSYEDKQRVVSWVNAELKNLGLAVKCPQTGKPAILVADVRDRREDSSRFRFEIRDELGRRQRTGTSTELSTLELIPETARRDGPGQGRHPLR